MGKIENNFEQLLTKMLIGVDLCIILEENLRCKFHD